MMAVILIALVNVFTPDQNELSGIFSYKDDGIIHCYGQRNGMPKSRCIL